MLDRSVTDSVHECEDLHNAAYTGCQNELRPSLQYRYSTHSTSLCTDTRRRD